MKCPPVRSFLICLRYKFKLIIAIFGRKIEYKYVSYNVKHNQLFGLL